MSPFVLFLYYSITLNILSLLLYLTKRSLKYLLIDEFCIICCNSSMCSMESIVPHIVICLSSFYYSIVLGMLILLLYLKWKSFEHLIIVVLYVETMALNIKRYQWNESLLVYTLTKRGETIAQFQTLLFQEKNVNNYFFGIVIGSLCSIAPGFYIILIEYPPFN